MKRTPLRRRTPLKAAKPIARRTKTRTGAGRTSGSGKPSAGIPEAVRNEIRARSGGKCEHCRKAPATEMHHRLPRSRGGLHDPFNLIHLCALDHEVTAHLYYHPDLMIEGYMLRGLYYGPNREYRQTYNGAPE